MKLKFVALVAAASLLGGCSTFHVAPYGATVSNVETIKSYNLKPVAVGKFQAVKPVASIPCRAAGPVTAAPSFEGYIEKAFTDELRLAGIYDAASPLVLTGKLEKLDFSSGMSDGNWSFTVTLTNARNESLTTVSKSEFEGAFVADKACQVTAQAFAPAVQKLVGDIVRDPKFRQIAN